MTTPAQHLCPLYPDREVAIKVGEYAYEHSTPLRQDVRDFHNILDATQPESYYTISKLEAQFVNFHVRSHGFSHVLEIGTYLGFTTMVLCDGVGRDGKVLTIEKDHKWADLANWELNKRGFENYDIRVGDAHSIIENLKPETPYDMVFIHGEKTGYVDYLEEILAHSMPGTDGRILRPGGHIMASSTLRSGLVADGTWANPAKYSLPKKDQTYKKEELEVLNRFNWTMRQNGRTRSFVLPAFDGISMAFLED